MLIYPNITWSSAFVPPAQLEQTHVLIISLISVRFCWFLFLLLWHMTTRPSDDPVFIHHFIFTDHVSPGRFNMHQLYYHEAQCSCDSVSLLWCTSIKTSHIVTCVKYQIWTKIQWRKSEGNERGSSSSTGHRHYITLITDLNTAHSEYSAV